jgi:hypothetical protein
MDQHIAFCNIMTELADVLERARQVAIAGSTHSANSNEYLLGSSYLKVAERLAGLRSAVEGFDLKSESNMDPLGLTDLNAAEIEKELEDFIRQLDSDLKQGALKNLDGRLKQGARQSYGNLHSLDNLLALRRLMEERHLSKIGPLNEKAMYVKLGFGSSGDSVFTLRENARAKSLKLHTFSVYDAGAPRSFVGALRRAGMTFKRDGILMTFEIVRPVSYDR